MTSESQILANQTSLTPGLAGRTVVISDDDKLAYETHRQAYLDEFQPVGINETDLLQQLADLRFALKQMLAVERQLLSLAQTLDDAALDSLPKLSVYYHRKQRAAESTLKQLSEIQTARKAIAKNQLSEASAIQKLQQSRQEPLDPASIGFACSIPEIKTYNRYRELSKAAFRLSS